MKKYYINLFFAACLLGTIFYIFTPTTHKPSQESKETLTLKNKILEKEFTNKDTKKVLKEPHSQGENSNTKNKTIYANFSKENHNSDAFPTSSTPNNDETQEAMKLAEIEIAKTLDFTNRQYPDEDIYPEMVTEEEIERQRLELEKHIAEETHSNPNTYNSPLDPHNPL